MSNVPRLWSTPRRVMRRESHGHVLPRQLARPRVPRGWTSSRPNELDLDVVRVTHDQRGVRERLRSVVYFAVVDAEPVEMLDPLVEVLASCHADGEVVETGPMLDEALAFIVGVIVQAD